MSWSPPVSDSGLSAVGVDVFAGGFSVGVAEHFEIQAHLEEGPFGVDTFRANFHRVPVWTSHAGWPRGRFDGVDLLYGNPPCSPWSQNGRSMRNGRDSWRTDPNVDYARRYLEYGLRSRPRAWVLESVPPIQRSEFLLDVAQMWLQVGYAFTLVRYDAKFAGLPQQRRRCFLVAHTVEVPWTPHVPVLAAPASCGEALETTEHPGRVDALGYGHDTLLRDLRPGASLRDLWESRNRDTVEAHAASGARKPLAGRPLLMIHRLVPEQVSCTVVGMNVYIHPFEDRALGHLELARLCGYPDGYRWEESGGYLPAQVAKSVTPPAGAFLAFNLRRALEAGVPADPVPRRVTMWAPSQRVTDFRFENRVEYLDTTHDYTRGVQA